MTATLVNAADYDVPQDRMRVIIVGVRNDIPLEFIMPEPTTPVHRTLRDALQGLDEPKADEICSAPYSSRYMSRNRKRGWDEVAYTVPAMAKQVTLYPGSPDMTKNGPDDWSFGKKGVTRRLSYREAAAIQTFPKDMEFCGDLTSKYKQIGNAVPVKLAEVVATEIYKILQKDDTVRNHNEDK